MESCIFCQENFPLSYQLISDQPDFWYFVHNISPMNNFHSLLVYKIHTNGMGNWELPKWAVDELWTLLQLCSKVILESSEDIERVNIVSLNSWNWSKHLHYHLIPIFKNEIVKKVNSSEDGGWFTHLSIKEILDDSFIDYIKSICGEKSEWIINKIFNARMIQVKKNTILLRKKFKKLYKWK